AGRFGEAIGLMFQAVDDLIDVEQPAEHAGKQTSKDAEAGKRTYPVVHGIEATRALVARLETDAHALAHELAGREGRTNGALAQIVAYLARRDR
ncbi:MAG: polyprenyl synthetase family protein, partial [Planctomycetota bacterium]